MLGRVIHAIRDLASGLSYGYPACCVFNYTLDTLRGTPAGLRRGERYDSTLGTYVPCVFHTRVKTALSRQESLEFLNSGFSATHLAQEDSVEIRVNGKLVSGLRIPKGTDAVLLSQVRLREST